MHGTVLFCRTFLGFVFDVVVARFTDAGDGYSSSAIFSSSSYGEALASRMPQNLTTRTSMSKRSSSLSTFYMGSFAKMSTTFSWQNYNASWLSRGNIVSLHNRYRIIKLSFSDLRFRKGDVRTCSADSQRGNVGNGFGWKDPNFNCSQRLWLEVSRESIYQGKTTL